MSLFDKFICSRCGDSTTAQLTVIGREQLCTECYDPEEPEKKLFIVKGYKIWAHSEQEANQLVPMIENF